MRSHPSAFCLISAFAVLAAWLQTAAAAPAGEEHVIPKFSRALSVASAGAQTFTGVVVVFPPGAKSLPHRHGDAFVYAYVLSGRVRSALEGTPPHTYRAGEDWFEPSGAHHTLTENPSRTTTARLLVVFVAPTGAALKVTDPQGGAR